MVGQESLNDWQIKNIFVGRIVPMDFILIIGVFQALFMTGLVLTKEKKVKSDYLLSALFIAHGLTLFLAFMEIYNRNNGYPFPFFINLSTPTIFLSGPLLWFYIKSLTDQHFRFRLIYLLHVIPFLFVLGVLSLTMYFLPNEEKILIDQGETFKSGWSFPVIMAMVAVFTQGYYIWGLIMIASYRRNIRGFFSKTENIDLRWLKFLLVSAIIFHGSISLLYILDSIFGLMPYGLMQTVGYSFAAVFLIILGFYGHRQTNIFAERTISLDLEISAVTAKNTPPLGKQEEQLINCLLDHMKKEKPYLDPDLTLARLAQDVQVSPENLSSLLNGQLKMNFFDFVNHYRVEEFKKLCKAPETSNLSIMGMAWESGFNSKATFNRVFKNLTNLTPGDYLKKVSTK
jgi:AraC-like DNA-binding protein/succinate dehydrogenase hydrophobic anchor subunit